MARKGLVELNPRIPGVDDIMLEPLTCTLNNAFPSIAELTLYA